MDFNDFNNNETGNPYKLSEDISRIEQLNEFDRNDNKLVFMKSARFFLMRAKSNKINLILIWFFYFFLMLFVFIYLFTGFDLNKKNVFDDALLMIYNNSDSIAESMAISDIYKNEFVSQLNKSIKPYCNDEDLFNSLLRQEPNPLNKEIYIEFCDTDDVSKELLIDYFKYSLNELKENDSLKSQLSQEFNALDDSNEFNFQRVLDFSFFILLILILLFAVILIIRLGFLLFIHDIFNRIFNAMIGFFILTILLPFLISLFFKDSFISILGINFKVDFILNILRTGNSFVPVFVVIGSFVVCFSIIVLLRYLLFLKIKRNDF